MLERAAACIESAGLGHIIRLSTRPRYSQKALHPGFWTHGATQPDLLYSYMMGVSVNITDNIWQFKTQSDVFASQQANLQDVPDGIYLDFLYPAKSLALIRKLSDYDISEWKRRRPGKAVSNNRRRRYTSTAAAVVTESHRQSSHETPMLSSQDSTIQGAPASQQPNDPETHSQRPLTSLDQPGETNDSVTSLQSSTSQQTSVSRQPTSARQAFNALPHPGSSRDYERAWQLYRAGEGISQVEIIEYLSLSTRVIDAERVQKIFKEMDYAERVPQAYRAMIAALLVLRDATAALKIHEEARKRQFRTSFGTKLMFAHAIDSKKWQLAFSLWHTYWHEIQRDRIIPVLWDDVVKLPNLIDRALSLASFTHSPRSSRKGQPRSREKGSSPSKGPNDFRVSHPDEFLKFTSGVIRTALFRADDPKRAKQLYQLVMELTKLKGDKKYYERAIMHFFQVKMTKLALQIYIHYRKLEVYQGPQRTMLDAVLFAFFEADNAKGIQLVLDDWTRIYGGPDIHTYREAMRYFARRGDAAVVEALLNGYLERAGRLRSPRELVLLLEAYARQGDLRKTINGFNEIKDKFRLKPDQSCWNTLLYAYSKAEDADGASRCFDDMRNSGFTPDNYTLGTLINMCGRRGDVEGVLELFELAEEHEVEMTAEIYDGLILAHINNGDVDHAQNLAEAAMSMKLKGSYTRMWNYVLHARAFQRRFERTIEVYKRMHQLRMQNLPVQADHLTYATLMQAFVQLKDPIGANEILEDMLIPGGEIKVTAFHYALVMAGYLEEGVPTAVFKVYERMIKRGLKPTMNTNVALVRAGILADKRFQAENGNFDEEDSSVNAERVLEQVLANTNVMEIAGSDPIMWKGGQPISTAYPAAYFDFLIYLYGRRKAFDKVKSLYESYLRIQHEQGRDEVVTPPLRMINALIMASSHEGDYDAVERCWKLATSEAAKQARKWNLSDTAKGGWVAPARRYVLAFSLTQYLTALAEQGRIQEMKDTVDHMIWDGYRLDKTNWNIFIQLLTLHGQLEAALGHCERELMPGWKGWKEERKRQGFLRLRSRVYDVSDTARPFYKTMLYLARAVMDLESSQSSAAAGEAILSDIAGTYPRTMAAIRSTPYREDRLQETILKWR